MELVHHSDNIFDKYAFYSFNEKGEKQLLGEYDFADSKEDEIIRRENQAFLEATNKFFETINDISPISFMGDRHTFQGDFYDQALPTLYPHFTIVINSEKIADCLIRGISMETNKRTVSREQNYLSLKPKSNGNTFSGTYNITMDEHEEYNIQMLENNLVETYFLSIKIQTAIIEHVVEIRNSYQNKDASLHNKWRTWFVGRNPVKLFHIGIHPQIKINGVMMTKIVIDNFIDKI